ncbi:hypothetical protein EXIGLDRAFT_613050 [Exidia glandulosa HHB12029]|uniref:FHF complex subunit HOOK-interacting protein C-terminal domain-containing protein n=1 Tax=Exidia glandulosa HHB12029 TaxID=1314781 RepID=A0A165IGZ6_EXIGL|nr:hypothetical protein EXIGLDRAFT_613050 [Exidia glandulosa HHB12029]
MDYFTQFLRQTSNQLLPKQPKDHVGDFHVSWTIVKETLEYPDERQLSRGIASTEVPARLKLMVDALVSESTSTEEGTFGPCLEYLLKNDVLGTLVFLSENDRPAGVQAEVLRTVNSMIVSLDEQFLVHSAVHKAVIRLLRTCAGDELQERIDGRSKAMGAAGNISKPAPSEYEEDLVDLLCIICGRIRTYRDLLMIFFHDKNWFQAQTHPLPSLVEEDEEEDEEDADTSLRPSSPTPSQKTVTSAPANAKEDTPAPAAPAKPEYEFLIFNYLLRFVHREGKIGDFARAGLLFLMDVAMSAGSGGNTDGSAAEDQQRTTTPGSSADPVAEAELALAEYVLDGDFAEVLGAGLGAVYSVLPSKLEVRPEPHAQGTQTTAMMLGAAGLAGSDEEARRREHEAEKNEMLGIEPSTSAYFRSQLDHFLKLLEFVQDVLRRNEANERAETMHPGVLLGNAITNSILDATKRVFLENILYTSILECSEVDGSAVAVMSYIDVMLRTLKQNHFSDLLVEFLTSEDDSEYARPRARRRMLNLSEAPPMSARARKLSRRKSSAMMLLEMEGAGANRQSMYLTALERFTLKDLILTNLRSESQSTAAAALQLLQTLLSCHCHSAVEKLLIIVRDPSATMFPEPARIAEAEPPRPATPDSDVFIYPGAEPEEEKKFFESVFSQPTTTIATHEREMQLYMNLVAQIDVGHSEDPFSTGYDHYLSDALLAIQSHSCSADLRADEGWKHRLDPNGPLLSALLQSLRQFFANTPERNVALTGVFAQLAMCPTRSLAGWLTFGTASAEAPRPASPVALDGIDGDGDDRSIDGEIDSKLASTTGVLLPLPDMGEQAHPVMHGLFQGLIAQLDRYRSLVNGFDRYLVERRQGLLFAENLNDALSLALELDAPVISAVPPSTPPRPKPTKTKSGPFSFLTPKKKQPAAKATPNASPPGTPPRGGNARAMSASPFAPHYQQTSTIAVEALAAPIPPSGPWTPRKNAGYDVFGGEKSAWADEPEQDEEEEERTKRSAAQKEEGTTRITLSQLLDNVVILEESIKELTAILHARRTLGIDAVRFV